MRRNIEIIGLTLGLAACGQTTYATDTSVPFIYADSVHDQGITGRGVTVAVIDDGVMYSILALDDIASGGVSFVPGNEPFNDGGATAGGTHGTLVSAIITDETGVAPDAKMLPIEVLE
ncbi:MAG: S8 family serine peptidase [Planctomycetota bacterium]